MDRDPDGGGTLADEEKPKVQTSEGENGPTTSEAPDGDPSPAPRPAEGAVPRRQGRKAPPEPDPGDVEGN